jgi:2-isopropylmalate synthase
LNFNEMDKIAIFDTTLRDGEQAPGASLNPKEKLEVARQLSRLGVDVIEAGFPVSSPGDLAAIRSIAAKVRRPIICALARALKKDIDAAFQAVKPAKRPRIHVFLATSKIHMRYKLRKAKDEILRQAVASVKYARRLIPDIEFSPEDASRTEKTFLFKVIAEVIEAGASTLNIPDTVGFAQPEEFAELIRQIRANVPNITQAVISVHCHNDLGLAVANSLAAVRAGAGQVECTINGIGERAGNASLEEIVMTINTRREFFEKYTSINTREIYKTSRLVSKLTGFLVAPNKAIVGQNAFRHEAGIHQDGVLKERLTYEIISPQEVGYAGSHLVLGKHSGRHAFGERLMALGYKLKPKQIDKAFERFKELADKKKEIFDEDLENIIEETATKIPQVWELEHLQVSSGTKVIPTATVRVRVGGRLAQETSSGDGPVDACFKAIDKITHIKAKLLDYRLEALTRGKDAIGEVMLKLKSRGKVVSGRGTSTDIIEASVKAYLNALNKIAAVSQTNRE